MKALLFIGGGLAILVAGVLLLQMIVAVLFGHPQHQAAVGMVTLLVVGVLPLSVLGSFLIYRGARRGQR